VIPRTSLDNGGYKNAGIVEGGLTPVSEGATSLSKSTTTTPRQSVKSKDGSHSPDKVKDDNNVGGRSGEESSLPPMMSSMTGDKTADTLNVPLKPSESSIQKTVHPKPTTSTQNFKITLGSRSRFRAHRPICRFGGLAKQITGDDVHAVLCVREHNCRRANDGTCLFT